MYKKPTFLLHIWDTVPDYSAELKHRASWVQDYWVSLLFYLSVLSPDPGGYHCPFAFLIPIKSIPPYPNVKQQIEHTFQVQIGFWRELELAQQHLKFGIQCCQCNLMVLSHFQFFIIDLLDQIIKFGEDCNHWNYIGLYSVSSRFSDNK